MCYMLERGDDADDDDDEKKKRWCFATYEHDLASNF